jgi:3-hydroxybutyryl-CoA dehydrogenase
MDLTGIDLAVRGRYEKWQKTKDPADKPAQFLIDQYLSGNYGRKTGKGWYDYTK